MGTRRATEEKRSAATSIPAERTEVDGDWVEAAVDILSVSVGVKPVYFLLWRCVDENGVDL